MTDESLYLTLIKVFAPLSLISIGGGQSIVGDIHYQTVSLHHWLTQSQFIDLFAISRAAPGPGALLTTIIGWQLASWKGAMIASLALFLPSSVLAYFIIRVGHTKRDRPWYRWVQNGLAPVATGLILGSSLVVLRGTTGGLSPWFIAAIAAAIFIRFAKTHPIPVLLAGGCAQVMIGFFFGPN